MLSGGPSYRELVNESIKSIAQYIDGLDAECVTVNAIYSTLLNNWHLTLGDVLLEILLALCLLAARRKMSTWLFKGLHFTDPNARRKLPTQIFSLVKHLAFATCQIYLVGVYDLYNDPAKCFANWAQVRNEETPTPVRLLSLLGIGYYMSDLFVVLFVEERRKDTRVMIAHHLSSMFLIQFSLTMRFWQISLLVQSCHDICDVFVDLAKILNYYQSRSDLTDERRKTLKTCSTLAFGVFATAWCVFRLVIYPKKALWAVFYHSPRLIDGAPPFWLFYCFLLTTLQMMHIYWFYFIVKLVLTMTITGQRLHDNREYSKTKTQ